MEPSEVRSRGLHTYSSFEKLSMNLRSLFQIGSTGEFRGIKASDVNQLPVLSGAGHELPAVLVNPSREVVFSATIIGGIGKVLRVGCQSQVGPFVVGGVPVDMVYLGPFRNVAIDHHPNDSMNQHSVSSSFVDQPSAYSGHSICRFLEERFTEFFSNITPAYKGLVSLFIREVMQWTILPEKLSSFRFVQKTLAQELDWWNAALRRKLSFLCHCFTGFEFRASGVNAPAWLGSFKAILTGVNTFRYGH